jgi:hypothetical protein
MEMVNVNQNLARTIYHVFKIVVVEIISASISLERQLRIVRKTVECVETVIVIIRRVVKRVLMIVGHVYNRTHIVGMEPVNTIIMRTVCCVQKTVERVPHLQNQFVAMVHVTLMKIVLHVQLIVLDPVRALMEKCEMI